MSRSSLCGIRYVAEHESECDLADATTPGPDAIGTRLSMDAHPLWLASLEFQRTIFRSDDGGEDQEMVVGGEQLEVACGYEAQSS